MKSRSDAFDTIVDRICSRVMDRVESMSMLLDRGELSAERSRARQVLTAHVRELRLQEE